MMPTRDTCLAAVASKDARFDGTFVTGVTSTGIYCRPSCPARTPAPRNCTFHASSAAAQAVGFRACKRCRPDAVPGSPEWDIRADVTARAMRLIGDGVVDRDGVAGLASRLGYSVRQVQRLTRAELGATPVGLARAQRAHAARVLLQTTELPLAEVAFAAGFGSLRSFTGTIAETYAATPTELRAGGSASRRGRSVRSRTPAASRASAPAGGSVPGGVVGSGCDLLEIHLRLSFRQPFHPSNVFGHLAATGVPGVEEWRRGAYRRTLRLPHGPGLVSLAPRTDHIATTLHLSDPADLTPAIGRCRRLLDLDADPVAVDAALAEDPILAPLIAAAPGRRIPRTVDGAEFAIRAVLGQQVSTAAARTHARRLVERHGEPVSDPVGGLTHLFPEPADLVDLRPDGLRVPASRLATLRGLVGALTEGSLDLGPGADRDAARATLIALTGIGGWTAEMVAMRSLGDPDAFPATDLGLRRAGKRLGGQLDGPLVRRAERWRPWRAYATQYLWAVDDHPINHQPTEAS
ncbi:MAG: AlkA N-terminal domain-containing protein [Propioniciclava sp.]